VTAVANQLAAAIELLLERIDHPPAANCSCHLSPPCGDCTDYGGLREAIQEAEAALAAHEHDERHPDDRAVDAFAIAMKLKLAEARAKGRGGWHDPAQCSAEDLSRMLREHVEKGDPRDVANFCMMLHQRGEAIAARSQATRCGTCNDEIQPDAMTGTTCRCAQAPADPMAAAMYGHDLHPEGYSPEKAR